MVIQSNILKVILGVKTFFLCTPTLNGSYYDIIGQMRNCMMVNEIEKFILKSHLRQFFNRHINLKN